ncbi:iron uptake system protein EfeO [Paenibacillus sp. B1-33]|uniref:iron uptake system protein EfeO n=1 Tax=unclassified Paenibacillus TaxID=185978 RepID=UPI003D2C131E
MKRILLLTTIACTFWMAAGCSSSSSTGTDGANTGKQAVQESAQDSGITSEMKDSVDKLNGFIDKLEQAVNANKMDDVKKQGKEMNSFWLSFENGVRTEFPFEYTEIEKHLQPIYIEAVKDEPNTETMKKEIPLLKTALSELASAKKGNNKASEQLQKAAGEYKAYVREQSKELVSATKAFTDAVIKGDMNAAKELYPKARVFYERIEPIAESFGDLDPSIDARENDAEDIAKWGGFHRIEKALWIEKKLEGQTNVAKQLMKDVAQLDGMIQNVQLTPEQMVAGSMELLNEAGISKITGEEERYSRMDLVDLAANVEGSKAVYLTVKSALVSSHSDVTEKLDKQFEEFEIALNQYRQGDSFIAYDKLEEKQIRDMSQKLTSLSQTMSQIANVL